MASAELATEGQVFINACHCQCPGFFTLYSPPFNLPALFGEDPADRCERLQQLLARVSVDAIKRDKDVEKVVEDKDTTKTWYHEGSGSLLNARYLTPPPVLYTTSNGAPSGGQGK